MSRASEQQHVGDDVVVICGDEAAFPELECDDVRPAREDLLVATGYRDSLEELRSTEVVPELFAFPRAVFRSVRVGSDSVRSTRH